MVHIGDLSENMKVRTRDGVELGTIIRLDAEGILVEKGLSLLEDHLVPVELVSEVRDGAAYLSFTHAELPLTREGLEIRGADARRRERRSSCTRARSWARPTTSRRAASTRANRPIR